MISQEEVTVRLGLDTRQFDRRLREADAITRKYANKTGSALNTGSVDGHTPQSWQGIANLSKQSQALLQQRSGLNGLFGDLGRMLSTINPEAGMLVSRLSMIGAKSALIAAPVGMVVGGLAMMRNAFNEVKEAGDLDVSVSFMRQLSKASFMAGESVDEAKNRIMRFQVVLASAAEGNKEALEKLGRVGIKDPTGKTMEENLRDVAGGLANITDKAQQAKAAVELFGKGAQASMPDILAELGQGGNKMVDENTAVLAAGWKGAKGLWSKTGGAAFRGAKQIGEAHLAAMLQTYFGVEAEAAEPSKLDKTESDEARAAREAKAKKYAADLTEAKKDYARAVKDGYTTEQKAIDAGLNVINIKHRLATMNMDELERTKAQTELVKEQNRYNELNTQLVEKRKAADEKRLSYEKQLTELQRQQKEIQEDAARGMRDRSGWTVGQIVSLGGNKRGFDGLPILSGDLVNNVAGAIGRPLTGREIQQMRMRAGGAMNRAGQIAGLEDAAHTMSLLGFGDKADEFMKRADKIRKGFGALTSQEQDPMIGFKKSMESVDKNIADLTAAALKDGIKIQPRMGK